MKREILFPFTILLLIPLFPSALAADGRQTWPSPRRVNAAQLLKRWSFDESLDGWHAQNHCRLAITDDVLAITCTGGDPYLATPVSLAGKTLLVRLRARSTTGGKGQLFWTTASHPHAAEARSRYFRLNHDGRWHEYDVPLQVSDTVKLLRLDPGSAVGLFELDWLEIHRAEVSPIRIEGLASTSTGLELILHNEAENPVPCSLNGATYTAPPGKQSVPLRGDVTGPYPVVEVRLQPQGHPPILRTAVLPRPEIPHQTIQLKSKQLAVKVARDGSGAQIVRGGRLVALLAPLVLVEGKPTLLSIKSHNGSSLKLGTADLSMSLEVDGDEIHVRVKSEAGREVEGPVLRALGSLEQGLFAGLEHLGKEETSSSTLDVETEDHLRFTPDPLKVTLPLMAVRTDRATVAMSWKLMSLRPVFSTPNRFDGSPDHLMALRGREISATITVRAGETAIEETVLWAVNQMGGLPPLPAAPRSHTEQLRLARVSIEGPIAGPGGWGHCAEKKWGRNYYADIASTLWRVSGEVPSLPRIVPGGAHVPNHAIYFVSGRAREWLERQRSEARRLLAAQQNDGGFIYRGKYRKGHFEDTSSGLCAWQATKLLEIAYTTGDAKALAAGVKTLEYMKRFRTPRGAQTWELSLHTPDVLASAYLVWAYVRGYVLTGENEYLKLARRWALSGIPFVYLWERYPVMRYATPPALGATDWRAPLWIGLPVQWCGVVYAYALTLLAPHDDTLDWTHLARGILLAGEQIQYPDGPLVGCLPDIFELPSQRRAGPSINPCALMSLRLALEGQVDSLSVATDGGRRIVAPFAVTIRDGMAHIKGRAGTRYQVIIDGERITEVDSKGHDVVALE